MGKTKILIVEDELIVAEAIKNSLESMDYEVVSMVRTGKEADESAEKDPPDIILMDIRLKGDMDGIETAERIRSRLEIPVIFLTAYADEDELARAKLTLPFGYVLKPFQDKDLRVAIEMALYTSKIDAERKQVEVKLQEKTHELGERVKELSCLYDISHLVEKPDISLTEILQGSVDLVPPSWQYPEITCARITFEGQAFLTEHFQETTWKQASDIIVRGNKIGGIEVYYLEETPTIDEGPFLREERDLIDAIAGRLGRIIYLKKAEDELRESEERYRILIESADRSGQAIIITQDMNGLEAGSILSNETAVVVTGYSHEELSSLSWFDILTPRYRDAAMKRARKRIIGENISDLFELAIIRKDGVEVPIEASSILSKFHGETALITLFRDITDRKQAEEALAQSERYYRTLIFSLHEQIMVIDRDYHITDANNIALQTLGVNREDVIGRHCYEISHGLDAPCHEQGEQCGLRSVFDTGEYCNLYHEHIIADGKKAQINIMMSPIRDKDGNITHVVEASRDVTGLLQAQEALRESEERYKDLYAEAPVGYVELDNEGRITRANRMQLEMWGCTEDQAIGQHLWELVVEKEESKRLIQAKLSGIEPPSKGLERTYKRIDGSTVPVVIDNAIVKDKEGQIIGMRSIIQDITERKRLEAQLHQSQKMESIGTLAGGIAHDFNNILSPIMIHSEMAMMGIPPENPLQQNMKQIFKAGERARDLVKQILTFARKQENERIPIKISLILKEVIKLLRSSIPTTINIQYNINPEQDTVLSDPTQLNQIIMNLCTNAAHAMEEKGGTLEVILANYNLDSESADEFSDLEPGRYAKLSVRDTGYGIEPQFMDKVFEPYFTTKEVGKGTGMGLALVHGIVKSYGGAVTVQSELGKGTSFHVYLPLVEEEADILETAKDSVQLPTGTERILFVDDEKSAVDAFQPMLESLGYKVTARTSSIEALEAFRYNSDAFDLVITDMTMPNMAGDELAKKLLQIHPDIPIIICTGFSEKLDERKVQKIGISAYVMKPIAMQQIANTIRQVLDEK